MRTEDRATFPIAFYRIFLSIRRFVWCKLTEIHTFTKPKILTQFFPENLLYLHWCLCERKEKRFNDFSSHWPNKSKIMLQVVIDGVLKIHLVNFSPSSSNFSLFCLILSRLTKSNNRRRVEKKFPPVAFHCGDENGQRKKRNFLVHIFI